MPKKVIVTTLWSCSLCEAETDEEKVTPYTLTGERKTLALDVCETCKQGDIWQAVISAGIPERAASNGKVAEDDGKVGCQYCGERFSPTGMGLHQSRAHNVKSKTEQLYETRGKSGSFACEECDFRAVNAQGLGAHMRTRHDVVGTSSSAVAARGQVELRLAAPGEFSCADCDFIGHNKQALASHRRYEHGLRADGSPAAPRPGEQSCPHCDFTAGSPQGMAVHVKHKHVGKRVKA